MAISDVFSKNLKLFRETLGVSQDTLSAKSGVKKSHISKIENSPQNIKLETLESLADGLGVKSKDLLDDGIEMIECPKCLEREESIRFCLESLHEASAELRSMRPGTPTKAINRQKSS